MNRSNSEFRRQLLARRMAILDQREIDRSNVEQQQVTRETPADVAELAAMDTSAEYFLELAERGREELLEIQRALEKLHNGNYGACEDCGESIAIDRLRRLPQARHCLECATTAEGRQAAGRLHP